MSPTSRIEAAAERSSLIDDAYRRAQLAHAGQIRNASGGMPYIEHPVAVAALLDEHGYDEQVMAAALLHDVVEDSTTTVEEVRQEFGETVAALVDALSDDESIESYLARKDEHRERVAARGDAALAIYAADKLTNATALRRAYQHEGEEVAAELKVPLDVKLEIWDADAAMLAREAPELPFLAELVAELSRLRADRASAAPRPGT